VYKFIQKTNQSINPSSFPLTFGRWLQRWRGTPKWEPRLGNQVSFCFDWMLCTGSSKKSTNQSILHLLFEIWQMAATMERNTLLENQAWESRFILLIQKVNQPSNQSTNQNTNQSCCKSIKNIDPVMLCNFTDNWQATRQQVEMSTLQNQAGFESCLHCCENIGKSMMLYKNIKNLGVVLLFSSWNAGRRHSWSKSVTTGTRLP